MSKTLFDLTYELARALGVVEEGIATGGSTTTLIDTIERDEADDFWLGGTAWILYDAAGAGAAPQGEYSFISDFVQSTATATLRSTLTAAVASGDRYAVARTRYPLSLLIQKINESLTGVVIEKTDISTITTAVEQTEYSLPTDVIDLKEVWVQTNLDDTNDNRWERIYDYHLQKSATGTANKIVFDRQYSSGYLVKLVYLAYHATLRVATDKLDDSIHINKVIYQAAVGCLLQRKAKVGESDPALNDLLNYYQNLAGRMDAEHAVDLPKKSAKTIHLTMPRP
jgi:hypothetical protein